MNKNAVKNILGEDRTDAFYRLLNRNDFLQECIVEILNNKLLRLSKASSPNELTDSGWSLKRAYQDGGKYHLESFKQIFTEQSK